MRQDVTNYELGLKISECMLINFEFLISIWNFDFWFWILSTKNFVCCNRNAIFCACKISRPFADHPSKIWISKVDKFRSYRKIDVFVLQVKINYILQLDTIDKKKKKHLSTSIKYRRFKKIKIKKMYVGRYFITHYSVKNGVLLRKSSLWWLQPIGNESRVNITYF